MKRDEAALEARERLLALERARAVLEEHVSRPTDGKWLEELTVNIGPRLAEWDVEVVYPWGQWPDRELYFPDSAASDFGIDLVAVRGSDGAHIAIQCKSRFLNSVGKGSNIAKKEFDSFVSASRSDFWSERWLVTNSTARLSAPADRTNKAGEDQVKQVVLAVDVSRAVSFAKEKADGEHSEVRYGRSSNAVGTNALTPPPPPEIRGFWWGLRSLVRRCSARPWIPVSGCCVSTLRRTPAVYQ